MAFKGQKRGDSITGNKANINWFPGHMAKTRRRISEDLKLVDIVVEILDARIPKSSANPELAEIIRSKPKMVLLNKSDMADPQRTSRWVEYFKKSGTRAVPVDCKSGRGLQGFYAGAREVLKDKIAAWESRGMKSRPVRTMVVGIPNVGKSSFINRLVKTGGKAEAQDRPGVTRQSSWFTVGNGFELLDTPGVLWPKLEDPEVGEHLAFTGAIKDEILDMEELASKLLELLMQTYPDAVNKRYKTQIKPEDGLKGYEILELIGKKRGMLVSGGEIDLERAANTVLDEYRAGILGRITLETP